MRHAMKAIAVARRLAVLGALSALPLGAGPAMAQQESGSQPLTLDRALQTIRAERRAVNDENRAREQRFLERRDEQQAELSRIRQEVADAEAAAAELEASRNENQRRLDELKAQLDERQGEFGELFGAARAAAADLKEQLDESLVSAQYPGRGEELAEIAESDTLPSIDQLEYLWFTLMQEANQQSKVVRFDAPVIGTDNRPETRSVTRLGPFTAFADGRYLQYGDDTLRFLPRQPGGGATAAAERVAGHAGDGFVGGVIDPSLGRLLGLVVESPTLRERVDQGGGIGYAIIVVALAGTLLALYKWVSLTITSSRVRAQMRSDSPSTG